MISNAAFARIQLDEYSLISVYMVQEKLNGLLIKGQPCSVSNLEKCSVSNLEKLICIAL